MNKRIEPFQVYTTPEAAELLQISERTLIEEIAAGNIIAQDLGKGWKILGDNLISYLKRPYTGGVPTQREAANTQAKDTSGAAATSDVFDAGMGLPVNEHSKGEHVDLTMRDGSPAIKPKK